MSKRFKKAQEKERKIKEILEFNTPKVKTGTFRRNKMGFGFVKVEEMEEEIYIAKEDALNAVDKDIVLVKILEESNKKGKKLEGKIIKVLKHVKEKLVGTFIDYKDFAFVIPDDKSFSSDIHISRKKYNGAQNNDKVVVYIEKYAEEGQKAEGRIVEILGKIDEIGVDILSLVKEYDVPYDFDKNVLEEAEKIESKIDISDIKNRIDLRDREIFTIDGEDAKDLDDGVEVTKNEDGTYNLGVHIADVSHYVKEGSLLDKEAISRGTSIYLLDRVIPMLPKKLSNGICSLNEKEDRFSLSCLIKIDKEGNIIDGKVKKAVINITKRMNYNEVNNIFINEDIKNNKKDYNLLNNEEKEKIEEDVFKYKNYIEHFLRMRELKDILRKKRIAKGYLDLNISETKIILDENGHIENIEKYKILESHEVIEKFMLTANEVVAEIFNKLDIPFIYRVHEAPDIDRVKELNRFLFDKGYKVDIKEDEENEILPISFSKILEEIKGRDEEKIISTFILRTLKLARYDENNLGHFGIGSKYYSHFTSPIRRYPDLFIHRVISKYLENGNILKEEEKEKYKNLSHKYAEISSDYERRAQEMERASEDIKMCEYMQDHIGEEYEGIISSVTQFGIFVELENTIEGLIRFDDLGRDYYIYDDFKKEIYGEKEGKVYKIGDKINIKVKYASKEERVIDFIESNFADDLGINLEKRVNIKIKNNKTNRNGKKRKVEKNKKNDKMKNIKKKIKNRGKNKRRKRK